MKSIVALFLLLAAVGISAAQAPEKLDFMKVKSVTLKYISNDMNDRIYAYTFSTDTGHRLDIRTLSQDARIVLMAQKFDPQQHPLQSPYEMWFVKMKSEQGQYLIHLLKESLQAMPDENKGKPHLAYLIDRMEGNPLPPGGKAEHVESMGEEY